MSSHSDTEIQFRFRRDSDEILENISVEIEGEERAKRDKIVKAEERRDVLRMLSTERKRKEMEKENNVNELGMQGDILEENKHLLSRPTTHSTPFGVEIPKWDPFIDSKDTLLWGASRQRQLTDPGELLTEDREDRPTQDRKTRSKLSPSYIGASGKRQQSFTAFQPNVSSIVMEKKQEEMVGEWEIKADIGSNQGLPEEISVNGNLVATIFDTASVQSILPLSVYERLTKQSFIDGPPKRLVDSNSQKIKCIGSATFRIQFFPGSVSQMSRLLIADVDIAVMGLDLMLQHRLVSKIDTPRATTLKQVPTYKVTDIGRQESEPFQFIKTEKPDTGYYRDSPSKSYKQDSQSRSEYQMRNDISETRQHKNYHSDKSRYRIQEISDDESDCYTEGTLHNNRQHINFQRRGNWDKNCQPNKSNRSRLSYAQYAVPEYVDHEGSMRGTMGSSFRSTPWEEQDHYLANARNREAHNKTDTRKGQNRKIGEYNGKDSFASYMVQFDIAATLNRWNQIEKAMNLAISLSGIARDVLTDMDPTDRLNYAELVRKLKDRFDPDDMDAMYKNKLRSRRKKRTEGIPELVQDINQLMRKSYPKLDSETRADMATDYFIAALDDEQQELFVWSQKPKNINEAAKAAASFETFRATRPKTNQVRSCSTYPEEPETDPHSQKPQHMRMNSDTNEDNTEQEDGLVAENDDERLCRMMENYKFFPLSKCLYCEKEEGHMFKECELYKKHVSERPLNHQVPFLPATFFGRSNTNRRAPVKRQENYNRPQ